MNKFFFEALEKQAESPILNKVIVGALANPKRTLGLIAALLGGAYLAPKIYTVANESEKKDMMNTQNAQLYDIKSILAATQQPLVAVPRKDSYDYL